jgi:tRNA/tmRNA/rRNA uracil-C5-methylase (TrmA/RlmC/RlmD family)
VTVEPTVPAVLQVGDVITVTIGPVAHGGHCVARHEGRVLFVRHVLPGEQVQVRVTEQGPKGRYLRAEVVEVIEPSPFRVAPPCRFAGRCGGCDFQHVAVGEQRRLKAQVVREQLTRLGKVDWAGVDWSGEVESVPDVDPELAGLRWRTRVRFAVDAAGRAGLVRHRSHEVVAIDDCVIAHPLVDVEEITTTQWPGVQEVSVTVSPETDERSVQVGPARGRESLQREAAGRSWQVSSGGFWQVHPQAADVLVEAVMELAQPQAGEHLVDLYAGVGLFAGVWGSRTGGRVDAVEGHRAAATDAEVNLADLPLAQVHPVAVEHFVVAAADLSPDVVVLDPPRVGAKRAVVQPVAAWRPRAVVYVACDPAALGRDVAYFAEFGYRLQALRTFDLFPMTHHVESVALFVLS